MIKAVNYSAEKTVLLVRLQGARVPKNAAVTLHAVTAGLTDAASLEHPDAIAPVSQHFRLAGDLSVDLPPHTIAVTEIRSN